MQISLFIGNLTKDPEKVQGQDLCKLCIAVQENYTTRDGVRPTQFFNVAVWNKMAEICVKRLKKGNKVAIVGRIQNRSWEDKDGIKRYAQEIVATDIEFLQYNNDNEDDLPFN